MAEISVSSDIVPAGGRRLADVNDMIAYAQYLNRLTKRHAVGCFMTGVCEYLTACSACCCVYVCLRTDYKISKCWLILRFRVKSAI